MSHVSSEMGLLPQTSHSQIKPLECDPSDHFMSTDLRLTLIPFYVAPYLDWCIDMLMSNYIIYGRVLTVHGSCDESNPIQDAYEFDKIIPNHNLHIIEGANHRYDNHQEELTAVVISFIKETIDHNRLKKVAVFSRCIVLFFLCFFFLFVCFRYWRVWPLQLAS